MPQQIRDVDLLRDYICGVMIRAEHHANRVDEVVLSLAGAIIWRKDDVPLEVFTREGEMKNVLWVTISGKRYALSYDHVNGLIEMRKNTTQGTVLRTFSNSDSTANVRDYFATL